jgi:hypothetical protein
MSNINVEPDPVKEVVCVMRKVKIGSECFMGSVGSFVAQKFVPVFLSPTSQVL